MSETQRNWAGNYTYGAPNWQSPTSVEAVQDIVRHSKSIKGLGSRHSFNNIGDSGDTILSMKQLNKVIKLDAEKQTVTVEGGITYGQLCPYLHKNGFALRNLASLPHISVVGACMTATHGSGEKNGNLATAISAIEIVTGNGEIIRRSRAEHGDEFAGMVVSLGALGVVTSVTLDIIPTFDMRQNIYLNMPLAEMIANFDAIQASAYSVSFFTHWVDDTVSQVWLKRKVDENPVLLGDTFFDATPATIQCSPVGDDKTERCTQQLGVQGAWYDRLPHFRIEFTPSHGDEIQSEFFVPRESAVDAIQAINELGQVMSSVLHVSEIRAVAADDLWMSTAYGRDTVAFHFTWKSDPVALMPVLHQLESALKPFDARPHWGKVFTATADDVHFHYERLGDFRALVNRYDPDGKFHNDFLKQYIL